MEREILYVLRAELGRQCNRLDDVARIYTADASRVAMAGEFDLQRIAGRLRSIVQREMPPPRTDSEAVPERAITPEIVSASTEGFSSILEAMQAAARG
jgi:hypothetical protein